MRELLSAEAQKDNPNTTYDLIANVVHDGQPNKGTYRVHILHKGTNSWHELQDLHVVDVLPQMITLSEAYIQVYMNTCLGYRLFFDLLRILCV